MRSCEGMEVVDVTVRVDGSDLAPPICEYYDLL